jgi:hypothetical protein
MPTTTPADAKGSELIIFKQQGMLLVLTGGGKLIPFVSVKRKNLPSSEIMFKCTEKVWMTEKLVV